MTKLDHATLLALTVGEPSINRGMSIAPIFPRTSPVAEYVALGAALALGASVEEVSEEGSVSRLVFWNPTPERVLLYDGEELVGAKQNRILDVAVLADAKSELTIPVSCVERGRWSRPAITFHDAPAAPGPRVRRGEAPHRPRAPPPPRGRPGAGGGEVTRGGAELGGA